MLMQALERDWSVVVRSLEYLPLGFGAHHWRASTSSGGDLFLALHELDLTGRGADRRASLAVLGRALSTARWLATLGQLDFVVGPLPDRSGHVVQEVAERFSLSVYPWLDAEPLEDPDGVKTASVIARLHAATPPNPQPDSPSTEDFIIPHQQALEDALSQLDTSWTGGPYAEPARAHVREYADGVRALMALYEHLARQAASSRADWVVTHGEPSGPNLLRGTDGRLHLVDWDTLLLAPRERDLWELGSTPAGLRAYVLTTGTPLDEQRMRLYEAWYALAEIAVYLAVFRSPHVGDANDSTSWRNLLAFLPTAERWPELGLNPRVAGQVAEATVPSTRPHPKFADASRPGLS
jgi:spectinomycin phosphotransferase